ncbi:hypothetical protein DFH09DRAFT_1339376 [Mycena vulgaris]|nr:hypothetical protein DFH09DRAFT_1339376 [Mycena vulgaris]
MGALVAGPFEGHTDLVYSLDFSPDGTRIVSASYDTTVRVWELNPSVLDPLADCTRIKNDWVLDSAGDLMFWRPPPLSSSPSDDDTDVPDQGMNRSSPAAAIEQNSDEEGTGADAPKAVALTYAKRALRVDATARAQAASSPKESVFRGRAPCAGGFSRVGAPPYWTSSKPLGPSLHVRLVHAVFVPAHRVRALARGLSSVVHPTHA